MSQTIFGSSWERKKSRQLNPYFRTMPLGFEWIERMIKRKLCLRMVRTDETVSIFNLNSFIVCLQRIEKYYLLIKKIILDIYLYYVKSKEIKEFNSSYEFIGRARLLNDQQWVYLTFDDPSEPSTANGKLIFYDALTNHTQEVASDIDSVSDLNTDFNN
ncbi:hypothetical protein LAV73_15580 [Lysinibacillus xylanilyticus]|uniref:hypothetical protein n=1 Tax=Lysinibacillus xylanilyticus TaxID=582475 RepID=UPI002B255453|nr:hypothetical protein [Lysinibacillus xylanilyticus]MEB2281403.1 hypothetical protein [Lysinibacillus xylanilyticus]